jgi:polysaccharide biosynthesis protein PslH
MMPDPSLRILYVTQVCPFGPAYGARIRVLNIGRLLQRLGRVSLMLAPAEGVGADSLARTKGAFESVHLARLEKEGLRGLKERFLFEADPSFLNTSFSTVSEPDREVLRRMMAEHDVTWVHTIKAANDFRVFRWPRSVLDIDDIPSRLYGSRVTSGPGMFRGLLNLRMSRIWRRRERLLKRRFDSLCVCSESDRSYVGSGPGIHVVRNGFSPATPSPPWKPALPPRLGFIGTFRYPPNRLGVAWFIRSVWPLVKRATPESRLRLVGLESDEGDPIPGPDIDRLGYLDDPAEEISTWSAMIVPIRAGGGTRIKITEAFSRRCPVVSTRVGAFGHEVNVGEDILLADRAEDFAAACVRLMTDPGLAARLSENAWAKFAGSRTWDAIGPSVARAIEDCLTLERGVR